MALATDAERYGEDASIYHAAVDRVSARMTGAEGAAGGLPASAAGAPPRYLRRGQASRFRPRCTVGNPILATYARWRDSR